MLVTEWTRTQHFESLFCQSSENAQHNYAGPSNFKKSRNSRNLLFPTLKTKLLKLSPLAIYHLPLQILHYPIHNFRRFL